MRVNRKLLKKLAELRFKEAKILWNNGAFSGAYYLAGYSIECAIKARIASLFQAEVVPDKDFVQKFYVHKLEELMKLSGLKQEFDKACQQDHQLAAHWGVVGQWSETARYEEHDQFKSADILRAVGDKTSGVCQWLKKHW